MAMIKTHQFEMVMFCFVLATRIANTKDNSSLLNHEQMQSLLRAM